MTVIPESGITKSPFLGTGDVEFLHPRWVLICEIVQNIVIILNPAKHYTFICIVSHFKVLSLQIEILTCNCKICGHSDRRRCLEYDCYYCNLEDQFSMIMNVDANEYLG